MANILKRLFGGDEQAKDIINEYEQCARESYWNDTPKADEAADRATDLFLEHDLYDYTEYANTQYTNENTGFRNA